MTVLVRVHPSARRPRTEQREDALHVWVNAPPVDGKANLAATEAIAALFNVPKSCVCLVSGHASKTKVFEIQGL